LQNCCNDHNISSIALLTFQKQVPKSIKHNPSWEANSLLSSQEILCIFSPRKSSAVLKRPHHFSLPCVRWLQSKHSNPDSFNMPVILSFHLRLGFPSGLFHLGIQTKIVISYSSYAWNMPCTCYPPWFHHRINSWWRVQILKLLIMKLLPASYQFLSLMSIYFIHYPILKHT
jgi:hypothetical protein